MPPVATTGTTGAIIDITGGIIVIAD